MKLLLLVIILSLSGINLFPQGNSTLHFIFVPHPRSEDQVHESVHPGLAKIDFTKYDVTMLGGDLTYSAGKDSATLAYCDRLFNLSSPNTLWAFGNHDVQTRHRTLIKTFTGRDGYYSYYRDGVTFIVLDTELNANSFISTFIKDDQLEMGKNVCDTIKESRYLIILHHRLMWMINSEYFKERLTDSIAASSRSMDTTNFYSDIYPLLQNVKNKGIQVLVFGGDKTKINIEYSPEDSITFYTARLAFDIPDSINNVIVLTYNLQDKKLISNFVPLTDAITTGLPECTEQPEGFILNQNYPNPFNPATTISFSIPSREYVSLKVFDVIGREVASLVNEELSAGIHYAIWNAEGAAGGVYFYNLQAGKFIEMRKLVLLK